MILDGDLYELGSLPFPDLSVVQASFDTLPQDPYAEERLRSRRYSCFLFPPEKTLKRLNKKNFMQSSDINKYLGDVERSYEEVSDELTQDPVFLKMFEEFQSRTGSAPDSPIEVHQIRWHCQCEIKAPAPEGRHQDGFDYIAVFLINQHNVDGGELLLYHDAQGAPFFKKRLEPGEFVILNDKKLYHNAAPLVPTANQEDGHWDVFVLTGNLEA